MVLKAGRPTARTRQRVEKAEEKARVAEEVRLNVIFSRGEYKDLKRFALEKDMSVSGVVREALAEYMKKYSDT